MNEIHVQKNKTPKLIGIKTRKKNPVLVHFKGRAHHFLNFDFSDPIKLAKGEKESEILKGEDITFF